MPTYLYQGYSAKGDRQKGRLEAHTAKEARETLIARGIYPGTLRPATRIHRKFSAARRAILYRELGALLHAGVPLDRALRLLAENPELAAAAEAIAALGDLVREGQDFSQGISRSIPGTRDDETAILAAAEASGTLPNVCLELADHLEEESEVADQIRTALVYPAVVATLALLVLGVLVGFLLPAYDRLLSGVNQELPALTRHVLTFGRVLRHPLGFTTLFALIAGGILCIRRASRQPGGILPHRRYQLPVLGHPLSALARARFAKTIALLLEGGIPLQRAIETAGRATGSLWLTEAARHAADQVAHGTRFSDALSQIPILSRDLPGWAAAGEASGDLAPLMRHAARGHQRAWDRGLKRALALLEPLLIVLVGLLILLVALAILLPMLRLNRGLVS